MAESPASYIRLVQHLIEECILFKMSEEECVEALTNHAQINPIITSTVWRELEKENKEFFEEYAKTRARSGEQGQPAMEKDEEETTETPKQEIQNEPSKSVPTENDVVL